MVAKVSPKTRKGISNTPPYEAFLPQFIERIFRPELYKVLANMSDRKAAVTMQTLHEEFRTTTGTTASLDMFRRWMRMAGVELEQTFRIVVPEDQQAMVPGGERDPDAPGPRIPRGVAVTGSLVPGLGGLVDQD